jgi:hypothetical protein
MVFGVYGRASAIACGDGTGLDIAEVPRLAGLGAAPENEAIMSFKGVT